MYPPKFQFFAVICLLIIAIVMVAGCSDDKPTQSSQLGWSPLGTGLDSQVISVTVYDNKLIAGGSFNTAGGVTANEIAASFWFGAAT